MRFCCRCNKLILESEWGDNRAHCANCWALFKPKNPPREYDESVWPRPPHHTLTKQFTPDISVVWLWFHNYPGDEVPRCGIYQNGVLVSYVCIPENVDLAFIEHLLEKVDVHIRMPFGYNSLPLFQETYDV